MILKAERHHINYQRIEQAIQYLHENFRRQPELDEVAESSRRSVQQSAQIVSDTLFHAIGSSEKMGS